MRTTVSDGLPAVKRNRPPARKTVAQVIYIIFGIVFSAMFLFPIVYMIATSTKTEPSYVSSAGTIKMFIPDFDNPSEFFKNYGSIFTQYDIWRYALNSFLYAAIVIVINVVVNGLAGYVMAKLRFPGKKFLSFMIIFLIVVPVETSIIPLYAIVKIMLGFKNTASIFGVILPASISIFNVFLFTQFFSGIPKEYEEAARIDGASTVGVFFKIILPLSKPIVATVAVFCFIGVWNDYLWPSMILPKSLYPIQSALMTIQSLGDGVDSITTGEIMAALVVTSIPIFIIYIIAQKYIVQGFGSAGLKM